MLIVADASVLVPALADFGPEGDVVRQRLTALADRLHIVQGLTELEVLSALRKLVAADLLSDRDAGIAIRRLPQLPAVRHEITAPMRQRIWELRHNVTVYDAAYVALVERLESAERSVVRLATADLRLAATPGLAIEFEEFATGGPVDE